MLGSHWIMQGARVGERWASVFGSGSRNGEKKLKLEIVQMFRVRRAGK